MFKQLGLRVKTRRRELGITQKDLAKLIGVSQPSIVELEKHTKIVPKYIDKLAEALECSVNWLISGEESNLQPTQEITTVPLLSIAEEWSTSGHYFKINSKKKYQQIPIFSSLSGLGFALRLTELPGYNDDPLHLDPERWGNPPLLNDNTILIIDEERAAVINDLVLAHIGAYNVFLFGNYERFKAWGDDAVGVKGHTLHQLLNPAKDKIIGVCIQVITPLK